MAALCSSAGGAFEPDAESGRLDLIAIVEAEETELFQASREGRAFDVSRLLKREGGVSAAQLNSSCKYISANGKLASGTAFYIAARGGHLPVLQLLYDGGCDIEEPNSGGVSPLCAAADYGHVEVVEWLLTIGCEKDKATLNGNSAVHWAAVQGHCEVVALLLAAGCSKELSNTSGETPLHWASDYNHRGVVELLVAAGVQVNCAAHDGFTPLHDAVKKGFKDIVGLLLTVGADRTSKTPDGQTARQLAEQHQHGLLKLFDSSPSPTDGLRRRYIRGVVEAATVLANTRHRLAASSS